MGQRILRVNILVIASISISFRNRYTWIVVGIIFMIIVRIVVDVFSR